VTADYVRALEKKVAELGITNIRVTLGDPADPMLPPQSLDRAVLIHMYHEIGQPFALLYNLGLALKPGAEIGIVDANRRTLDHGTPPALLRCELAAMGYREIGFHSLDGTEAYLAIFELEPGKGPAHPKSVTCGS
jgi:hypothetical protein